VKHSLIAAVANGDLGFASEVDGSDAQKDKKGRKDTKQKMKNLVPPSCIHSVTNKNTTFKRLATFICKDFRISLAADREIPVGFHVKNIGAI
jgi:hypothetical protein